MKQGSQCFLLAGILLVSSWSLYLFALHDPPIWWLVCVGWVTLVIGLLFIFLAITTLRGSGRPEKGKDFAHSTVMVSRGVYAVVRHPLYLGWMLMLIAVIFFSQHWLVMAMAITGAACMLRIMQLEDQQLIKKYGGGYEIYMRSVPAVNFFKGIIRLLKQTTR